MKNFGVRYSAFSVGSFFLLSIILQYGTLENPDANELYLYQNKSLVYVSRMLNSKDLCLCVCFCTKISQNVQAYSTRLACVSFRESSTCMPLVGFTCNLFKVGC